jgi:ElaB/YqjD/DUF883 family membrane-anchored ribosome-binding protein
MSDNRNAGASSAGTENGPAEIAKMEAEIDRTRDAITGDLRTLGERLSPEALKQEASEVMTEAKKVAVETLHEARDVATNTFNDVKDSALGAMHEKVDELRENVRYVENEAIGFVRSNALPLALIGIGVAWFVSKNRARESEWEGQYAPRGQGRWRYPQRSESEPLESARDGLSRARGATAEYAERARDATSEYASRARGSAGRWVNEAERSVGDIAGRVRGFAEREVEQAQGLARQAQRNVVRVRDRAGVELRHAGEYSRQTFEAHPLAVGAGAVAAGLFLGLAIPETRRENELFGPSRHRLVGGVQDALSEAKEAVGDLGQAAKETARDVKQSINSGING